MSWRGPSAVQGSPVNVWQFPGLWMGGCRCPTARVCPMLFTAACGAGLISSPIMSWSRWSAVSFHLAPSRKRCALTPITTAGWRLQCCLPSSCQGTVNITPSSAFWPSSAVPPSTVSLSCRTTPPIRTLSSSLPARPSLPLRDLGTCSHSPRAPLATLTPQRVPRSQRALINTQTSGQFATRSRSIGAQLPTMNSTTELGKRSRPPPEAYL